MASDPVASPPPIDALLDPASIAIVGASPSSYVGRVLCENLRSLGYAGAVYPVNPRYDEILGWRCYQALDDVPEGLDAVVSAVRIDLAPEVLRSAAKLGARAAVVPGGGYTETGTSVLAVHGEIADVAREFGMAVAGPNCMGVIAPGHRSAMYIGTIPPSLLAGRVALVSQSGSVVEAAVNMGPRVGFSALVSFGTEAATTAGDYLRHLAGDEETSAVALFLEGFKDADGFIAGARALREAGKPLAVLQAGRSKAAAEAVAAHSGSLAGTDEVVTGLLHQLGAIGVDDLDELFEVAELLGHGRLPKGRRVFAVTDSGGEANLITDHADALALELPKPSAGLVERLRSRWPNFSYIGNPIDPWGVDADYHTLYREVLRGAAAEDVDVVAMALDKVTPWAGPNEVELGEATAAALIEATAARPDVLPVFLTVHATGAAVESVNRPLRAAGIPLLHGLRPAMVAIRRAWYWQQWPDRAAPMATSTASAPASVIELEEAGPILSELSSRKVLQTYGVPMVPAEAVSSPQEAVDAAERFGYPVVMKAAVSGVAHKMAAGLVRLNVGSRLEVGKVYSELSRTARLLQTGTGSGDGAPPAILVEATAGGVELICGMRRDPVFGPVVLLGAGGSLAEVLHDVAVRLCPPAPEDLREMLDECAAGRLLAAAGADSVPALDVVAALSHLALEHPEVMEVDVNPLFAGRDGAVAADALVVLHRDPESPTPMKGVVT
jgi:acyl-CoA synthetase (NDP forming)